jgi:hypothetical protein
MMIVDGGMVERKLESGHVTAKEWRGNKTNHFAPLPT